MKQICTVIILITIGIHSLQAQKQTFPETVSLQVTDVMFQDVIKILSEKYPVRFYYSSNRIGVQNRITVQMQSVPLYVLLDEICNQAKISYKIKGDQVIFYPSVLRDFTTVSGYITDSTSGERLAGASVYLPGSGEGTLSNAYGFYSLSLKPGNHTLRCSYMGYRSVEKSLDLTKSRNLSFSLSVQASEIKEVTLSINKIIQADSRLPGMDVVPVALMYSYPALMGEKDVVQFLKMLPGVQTTTEGLNGLFVRGCLPQHTSFLVDDAPMFNMFHFSGWFSTINPDAVKEVKLYKSHFPAKSGGSLGSIADIRLRDGNLNRYEIRGGTGTIMSRLTVEGPVIRNRASFIISARRTYFDQLVRMLRIQNQEELGKFYFYDLNAKVNCMVNERNRFYLSGYTGKDVFSNGGGTDWGNSLLSFRWNHVYNDRIFSNLTITGSRYNHTFNGYETEDEDYRITLRLRNYNLKYDISYYTPKNNRISFGINSRHTLLLPTVTKGSTLSFNKEDRDDKAFSQLITSIYLQEEWVFLKKLYMDAGLRLVMADKIYPDNLKTSVHPEPLLSATYLINENTNLRIGYSRNYQHYHGASVFEIIIPFDKYIMTGNDIKPQYADHASAGITVSALQNTIEMTAEAYISSLKNQYRFPVTTDIYFNRNADIHTAPGKLNTNGLELSIRKLSGRLNGMISYTWSTVNKTEQGVNQGAYFHPYYDRTNDLVVSGLYRFSDRFQISSNWIYMSGNPYSLPVGKYELRGRSIPLYDFDHLYNRRMPAYHRLDISARFTFGKESSFQHHLTLMVYNVYARKNPVFYNYVDVADGDLNKDPNKEYSKRLFSMTGFYFFNVFPSISYEFVFPK